MEKKMAVCKRTVNMNPATTAETRTGSDMTVTNLDKLFTVSPQRGLPRRDDLVDPLPRQTMLIGDLLQARTSGTIRDNLRVPLPITPRPRLQWPPLPANHIRQRLDTLLAQLPSTATLPDIANPRTKTDLLTIKNLDVKSRDVRVALSTSVLDESPNVHDKSVSIIHGVYSSTK